MHHTFSNLAARSRFLFPIFGPVLNLFKSLVVPVTMWVGFLIACSFQWYITLGISGTLGTNFGREVEAFHFVKPAIRIALRNIPPCHRVDQS